MSLGLPFSSLLPMPSSVLILGMGGGFDLFCGLPLLFSLEAAGHQVHLASISFANLSEYTDAEWLSPTLAAVGPPQHDVKGYHPERYLARWFETLEQPRTLWCIEPTGSRTVREDLVHIRNRINFEALILVDGGIDSLTRGDEELVGTVLEDYVSLAAADMMSGVPVRILASIGMGIEGDVSCACVFENIAAITEIGGFLGCSGLSAQMECFRRYEDAVSFVHHQPGQQPSVINASIISAARGHYGDFHLTERTRGSELRISPLMNLYWFFDLPTAARQNLFVDRLRNTRTAGDAFGVIYEARETMTLRRPIPFTLP